MKGMGIKNWKKRNTMNTALVVLMYSGNKSSSSQKVDHCNVKIPNNRLAFRLTDVTLLRCKNDNSSNPPTINVVVIRFISMRLKVYLKPKKCKQGNRVVGATFCLYVSGVPAT